MLFDEYIDRLIKIVLPFLFKIPWIQNEIGHDVDITIQSIKQLYWKV